MPAELRYFSAGGPRSHHTTTVATVINRAIMPIAMPIGASFVATPR
jgi:hypothetical protein